MNLALTDEQKMLQEMVREFARKEIEPHARKLEENHEFPRDIVRKLGEIGILGMGISPEFGGTFSDHLSLYLAIEEISWALPALAVNVGVHCSLFSFGIQQFGNQKQKEKYLPDAAAGKILGAFGLTEPGTGSDVLGLKTKAVKEGNEYLLNGTKAWVSTGSEAGAILIIANTEGASGKDKPSAFIVDSDAPGLKVTKIEEKMGLHSSPTAEIVLENCRVPAENLLGEEGRGAAIALKCLDGSRIGIAAQAVGLSQRAFEEALKYSRQREAFGQPISELEAIQFMLADISTNLQAARSLTYRAAWLFDQGKPYSRAAAEAKLFASEAANKIAYQALQIHGGYGYSKEFVIEQLYRDARVMSIYEGTSEIQRLVIARRILKDD